MAGKKEEQKIAHLLAAAEDIESRHAQLSRLAEVWVDVMKDALAEAAEAIGDEDLEFRDFAEVALSALEAETAEPFRAITDVLHSSYGFEPGSVGSKEKGFKLLRDAPTRPRREPMRTSEPSSEGTLHPEPGGLYDASLFIGGKQWDDFTKAHEIGGMFMFPRKMPVTVKADGGERGGVVAGYCLVNGEIALRIMAKTGMDETEVLEVAPAQATSLVRPKFAVGDLVSLNREVVGKPPGTVFQIIGVVFEDRKLAPSYQACWAPGFWTYADEGEIVPLTEETAPKIS